MTMIITNKIDKKIEILNCNIEIEKSHNPDILNLWIKNSEGDPIYHLFVNKIEIKGNKMEDWNILDWNILFSVKNKRKKRLEDELKCFMDGDSLCVTKMNFRNLQEDEAVFIKIKKDKQDKVWQLTKDHPSIKCGCSKCKSATEFQASGGAP